MDNFMDKLAQRFTAQEMIRANAQAETQEMNRLREQVRAYDDCMQEIRKLNLRNVESAEQVKTLAEQVNGLVKQAVSVVSESAVREDSQKGKLEEVLAAALEIKAAGTAEGEQLKALVEQTGENCKKELLGQLEQTGAALTAQQELLKSTLAEQQAQLVKLAESSQGVEEFVHKECVKVYRNVQAVLVDELKGQTKELEEKLAQKKKGGWGMTVLLVVTMLLSLGNLAILVAQLLGIL